jgi:hypothetical protein
VRLLKKMATISILHEEDGSTSTVTVVLQSTILSDQDMARDAYLLISTNIKKVDGTAFPVYVIRDLTDVAPGAGAATTFTILVNDYIDYFVNEAQLGYSSSSSSSSSGSSSSSSSSEGYTSSSSSSSEGNSSSSSSSSSEGNSSSSSS